MPCIEDDTIYNCFAAGIRRYNLDNLASRNLTADDFVTFIRY